MCLNSCIFVQNTCLVREEAYCLVSQKNESPIAKACSAEMKMKRDVKNHMNKNSDSWSYNYCPTLISYKLTIISHCQTAYPLWPAETGFVVNGGAAVLKKVLIYWQYLLRSTLRTRNRSSESGV